MSHGVTLVLTIIIIIIITFRGNVFSLKKTNRVQPGTCGRGGEGGHKVSALTTVKNFFCY